MAETCFNGSIAEIIGSINGKDWMNRRDLVRTLVTSQAYEALGKQQDEESLKGQGVYASSDEQKAGQQTNYDIVNAWQVNFVRGLCTMDGVLLSVSDACWNDDAMLKCFYSSRPKSKVLDIGCNTGKNLMRALKYGGQGTEVFGIEFSEDSVAIARKVLGEDRVLQGDASTSFVNEHSWSHAFSVVQCTAVLQHLTPEQVDAALANMSHCLTPEGEVLLTFKDAPTKQQLKELGMDAWIDEVFTADLIDEDSYVADGFLRSVMWDDDYYPGVTSSPPPSQRDTSLQGLHCREFVFYSLQWMKDRALKHGLVATELEVMPDSKIPLGALHWMMILRRAEALI
jgi:SAM-dependent methyltransferase